MAQRIAILGWGSLIWEDRPEFDKHRESWSSGGPDIKLEFSRISRETRAGALTLVVDPTNGASCRVAYTRSKRRSLDDAICDLRCREGTSLQHIGFALADGSDDHGRDQATVETIREWAKTKGFDAVVWTDLPATLEVKDGQKFIDAALRHVRGLEPEGKAKAAEYVWRAPDFVDTPLRRALQQEPWFASNQDASASKLGERPEDMTVDDIIIEEVTSPHPKDCNLRPTHKISITDGSDVYVYWYLQATPSCRPFDKMKDRDLVRHMHENGISLKLDGFMSFSLGQGRDYRLTRRGGHELLLKALK